MNLDKAIKKRISIKEYSNKKVKFEKIIDIVEAANLAPSPGNLSNLKFILVENLKMIQEIAEACQQEFIKNAQHIIVICSEPKKAKIMYDEKAEKYINHHAGAAIQNILLKVTDLGLAACWVGYFSESILKNLLKIPDNVIVEALVPVAKKSKNFKLSERHKTDLDNVIYFETYKNKNKTSKKSAYN